MPDVNRPIDNAEEIDVSGSDWTNPTYTNPARGLWIGTGGDVKLDITNEDGDVRATVTLKNLPTGYLLPVFTNKVYTSGTGASNIVALY